MFVHAADLGRCLTERGIVTPQQLRDAESLAGDEGVHRLSEVLVELGFATERQITRAVAEDLEIPFVDLADHPPSPTVAKAIPAELALELEVVPLWTDRGRLVVAARDPQDRRVQAQVGEAASMAVVLVAAPESQIRYWILHGSDWEGKGDGPAATEKFELPSFPLAGSPDADPTTDAPDVIRAFERILLDANAEGASELHLKADARRLLVRYRHEGWLRTLCEVPLELAPGLIGRFKRLAGIGTLSESGVQEGNCQVRIGEGEYTLKVSSLRGVYGDTLVLRVLGHDRQVRPLVGLGMSSHTQRDLLQILNARHGLVLVVGPPGSGRTNTLYSAVSQLTREDHRIITVESPVEVRLAGITQVDAGGSFVDAIRATLRQEPDVLMVGEIRDHAAAEAALSAAMGSRLVLAALDGQNASGAAWALAELGVQLSLVTRSLQAVLAQQLARRVCGECAENYVPEPAERQKLEARFGSVAEARFRRGSGCAACGNSGLAGHIGIFELLILDDTLRGLLEAGASEEQLCAYLRERGFRGLAHDAFVKACDGVIPIAELFRLEAVGAWVTGRHEAAARPSTARLRLRPEAVPAPPPSPVPEPPRGFWARLRAGRPLEVLYATVAVAGVAAVALLAGSQLLRHRVDGGPASPTGAGLNSVMPRIRRSGVKAPEEAKGIVGVRPPPSSAPAAGVGSSPGQPPDKRQTAVPKPLPPAAFSDAGAHRAAVDGAGKRAVSGPAPKSARPLAGGAGATRQPPGSLQKGGRPRVASAPSAPGPRLPGQAEGGGGLAGNAGASALERAARRENALLQRQIRELTAALEHERSRGRRRTDRPANAPPRNALAGGIRLANQGAPIPAEFAAQLPHGEFSGEPGTGKKEALRALLVVGGHGDFYRGELVPLSFELLNVGEVATALRFDPDQGIEFEVSNARTGERVWSWRDPSRTNVPEEGLLLDPRQRHRVSATWDQRNPAGGLVPTGRYRVRAATHALDAWNSIRLEQTFALIGR